MPGTRIQGSVPLGEDGESQEVGWQYREYQHKGHDAVFEAFDQGRKSCLVVMPTGTGKTCLAGMISRTARGRDWKVLFRAHREILVNQAAATLEDMGLDVAIEMASQDAQFRAPGAGRPDVVVGTVQTLTDRRLASWPPDAFDLIISDECHRAAAATWRQSADYFGCRHLGITATPDGSSGAIGNIFETKAFEYSMREAVDDGWIIPPFPVERCKVPIDLRDMKATAGDFNARELAERISPSVGYIADGICQRIHDRYTVVFTPDVASARGVANALELLGRSARYVAGQGGRHGIPRAESRSIIADFNRRAFQVIVCCDLLFEGWDAPHVSAVVIARPTLVRYRFAQMVGRGTRLCPEVGKTNCLVVDFDWRTDAGSRELITTIDLWADEDDLSEFDSVTKQRILENAKRVMDEGETDPRAALEQCKLLERQAKEMPLWLPGTKAEFEIEVFDPLGVAKLLGLPLKKRYDYASPAFREATPGQVEFLTARGIIDAERMSMIGATKMIGGIKKRDAAGLSTWRQVDELVRAGVGAQTARAMTFGVAQEMLGRVGKV